VLQKVYDAENEMSTKIVEPGHPALLQKHKGINYFGARVGAQGAAARFAKPQGDGLPWDEAGPQACRLWLGKPFWFRRGRQNARPVLSRSAPPPPAPHPSFHPRKKKIQDGQKIVELLPFLFSKS
jgi:hypothetical protein